MRRRQISQQNNAPKVLAREAFTAPEAVPLSPPGPAPKRGWPKGKPRKPGVTTPYRKGNPV